MLGGNDIMIVRSSSTAEIKPASAEVWRRQVPDAQAGEPARVAILMCTYNGASFLREQLESFACQTYAHWTLYVSDDGSTDQTRSIIEEYQARWGTHRLVGFDGPREGFGKNFISLLKRPEVNADFYAFSDQDDVWFNDKLERGVDYLMTKPATTPSLYCSRSQLVDGSRHALGFSPLFARTPSFQNALVQSLAGANTMMINHAARDLLVQLPHDADIVAHDWLAYLLVTGSGGEVRYDARPSLEYRQHECNVIGANNRFKDRVKRLRKMLSGRFMHWNDANVRLLNAMSSRLTAENRAVLAHFEKGRRSGIVTRCRELHKSGVYRQTRLGNVTLIIAALLAKI